MLVASMLSLMPLGAPLTRGSLLSDVYQPPPSYTASLTFHIPYVPFSEPITAAVDQARGAMRLSYYAGQDVFIAAKAQPSFKIVPVDNEITCLNTTACVDKTGAPAECTAAGAVVDSQWQHVFPNDMSLFEIALDATSGKPMTETVQRCRKYAPVGDSAKGSGGAYTGGHVGRACIEPLGPPLQATKWTFATNNSGALDSHNIKTVCDHGDSSQCELWLGAYTFYTAYENGRHRPIQFKFTGHNVVLGGSHFDEYVFDYHSVTPGPIDSELFDPPMGMTCYDADSPLGPTAAAADSSAHPTTHPAGELVQLFPGGQADAARSAAFGAWRAQHGKEYATAGEHHARSMQYHRAARHIAAHNRQRGSYWLTATHFADWTDAERSALNGARWDDPVKANAFVARAAEQPHVRHAPLADAAAPLATVDWRKVPAYPGAKNKGALTGPPKDQGTCGSCWSFGAAGTMEGSVAAAMQAKGKVTPTPVEVSQQNLLDCSWTFGNSACAGGLDYEGFEWMLQNNSGKIASAASYGPYLNQEGFCHYDLATKKTQSVTLNGDVYKAEAVATIKGWKTTAVYGKGTNTNDPAVLKTLKMNISIANLEDQLTHSGPVSVSIDATPTDFYYYGGGVYDNTACTYWDLDHSVLAVGFGTVAATKEKYWIVKNSWSSYWGEEGYVRVAQKGNICGVASTPNYVTGLTV